MLHRSDHSSKPPPLAVPTLAQFVCGYMVEVFLYGINLSLFTTVILIVKGGLSQRLLLASAWMMFLASTAGISLSCYVFFGGIAIAEPVLLSVAKSKHMLYLVTNTIADGLLVYRCYAVWSCSFRVIVVPCLLLVGGTVYGTIHMPRDIQFASQSKFYLLWLTLFINISVTTLMAFRVWWIAHIIRKRLGKSFVTGYYSLIVILIETGALYSAYIIIYQVLSMLNFRPFALDVALTQVAALAPMLIIVQLGLGRHIRDVESTAHLGQGVSTVLPTTVNSNL